MKQTLPIWLAVLLAVVAAPCLAKKVHAPLSPKIMAAKTVYIENHADTVVMDRAYDELKKWGRFEIVTDRAKADVVLVLSRVEGESGSGTTSIYNPPDKAHPGGTWSHGTSNVSTAGYGQLAIVDTQTDEILYSDRRSPRFHSATREMIKELRKRIEEQEKAK